jgi:hypothetical protein
MNGDGAIDILFTVSVDGNPTMLLYLNELPPPARAGDFNANGRVEQGDLDLVLLHWGQAGGTVAKDWLGPLPDGTIDQGELDAVLLHWGAQATRSAAAPPLPLVGTRLDKFATGGNKPLKSANGWHALSSNGWDALSLRRAWSEVEGLATSSMPSASLLGVPPSS